MKWIKKSNEPNGLKEYRNSGGEWDDFSLERGKAELKERLLTEQKSLCAYCMGAIKFDNMKVEHWHPRANYPKKKLEYTNLLAVCQGCYGSGTEQQQHCDTSKGDRPISINPQNRTHIKAVSYKNNGQICSTINEHQNDIDNVLNLNIRPLVKNRKSLLDTLRISLNRKYRKRKANYQKELKKWESCDKPYCMVAIRYFEKKINQNK